MTHHTFNLALSRQQQQQQKPAPGSSKASGEANGEQPMTPAEREAAWKTIYRAEHRDFKGKLADGTQSLMSWAAYGGGLTTLKSISDAELRERLARARR